MERQGADGLNPIVTFTLFLLLFETVGHVKSICQCHTREQFLFRSVNSFLRVPRIDLATAVQKQRKHGHTHTHADTHTHTHTHMRAHTHTHTHKQTYTHRHTLTHTHTHIKHMTDHSKIEKKEKKLVTEF